jgi:hypothetical protein
VAEQEELCWFEDSFFFTIIPNPAQRVLPTIIGMSFLAIITVFKMVGSGF